MASGSQKVKTPAGWNSTQGAWVKTASSTWKAVDQIYVKTPTGWNDASGQQSVQQPYPYIANSQTPYIANAQQPYPYIANAQTPYIADAQQPYPYIANAQSPYIANARQPSTYNFRSPFTYRNPVSAQQPNIRNARQPAGYRNPVNARQPNIRNRQTPFTYNARYPAGYPANARQPFTYNARYPATYPANARQPFTYSFRSPFTYNFRSPYTYSYELVYYTLSSKMTVVNSGGYAFYIGFTDGNPIGGTPLGIPAPTSPTVNDLWSGSGAIQIYKSAPNFPAMIAADWLLLLGAAPNGGLAGNGFTALKISSPALSETTIPIPSTTVNGLTFSAPTWVTGGTSPFAPATTGAFTMKFIK